jgi:hypothetical protein
MRFLWNGSEEAQEEGRWGLFMYEHWKEFAGNVMEL